ncbi:MAG: recombinase family protein [Candidatus Thiodiazotropha sp.]
MSESAEECLIYCRVSDTKQKVEGSGLESQEFRCRQYAAQHQYFVEKVFHDDVSGGGDFSKRPGMMALLNYLEKNRHKPYVVIFDDLKRLARDTMFHWQLRHAMKNFGARLECLNYRFDDTPEGEFMETLFAAQGQLERKQIGRQTRQKTKARLEAGYHAFIAPVGYKYTKSKEHGKILVKDEPTASVLTQALESFATGRFQTAREVRCFLESAPEFPKQASGRIGNTRAKEILTNPLYAGMIVYEPWGVSMRKGKHEGLITYETFCRIQDRLAGRTNAPARKDLNLDFPLRGAVACECGNALTAAWSKSHTGKYYPYYVCQNRKCSYKGKSIRRNYLESEFESLLARVTPEKPLMTIAEKMFRRLWDHRTRSQELRQVCLEKEIAEAGRQIDQLLDRIVDAQKASVVQAFEKRIDALEKKRMLLEEKRTRCGQTPRTFDEMYRTAMHLLSNPLKIWKAGRFEDKRAVLRLVFSQRLIWDRKGMYRTPELSLPFRTLEGVFNENVQMVPRRGLEPPRGCPH